MDAAAAVRLALREAADQVSANAGGAGAGKDPEFLHQLRVGTRRLRAALHVSRGLWRHGDARALRRQLRELSRVTGPARDWDVLAARRGAALPAGARASHQAARAALRLCLAALPAFRLPRARAGARRALQPFAREALARQDRRIRRRVALRGWGDARQRHALRRRLRRLRYACEFLAGAFPARDAGPIVAALRALQDLLGELNDIAVARRLGMRGSPASRERRLRARLGPAWRRFVAAPRFWEEIGL
jgi:triphosphatase